MKMNYHNNWFHGT